MGFFGTAPTLQTGQTDAYMGALNNLGTQIGGMSGIANGNYANYNAANNNAFNNYAKYLSTNPATDQQTGQYTANAEQGASEGAAQAGAALDESLAARGLSPGSSAAVGGQAAIQEGLAANNANIQAQIGENYQNQANANKAALYGLTTGAANNAFNQAGSLNNAQEGIDQTLYGDANQQAQQQLQLAQQQQQAGFQDIGAIVSAGAPYFANFNAGGNPPGAAASPSGANLAQYSPFSYPQQSQFASAVSF